MRVLTFYFLVFGIVGKPMTESLWGNLVIYDLVSFVAEE
jgi:hypothetical protein